MLLTDAIAAAAPGNFAERTVKVALVENEGGLELLLGPMRAGGAADVRVSLGLPDVGGTLEGLADEIAAETREDGDYLAIRFRSPAPAP